MYSNTSRRLARNGQHGRVLPPTVYFKRYWARDMMSDFQREGWIWFTYLGGRSRGIWTIWEVEFRLTCLVLAPKITLLSRSDWWLVTQINHKLEVYQLQFGCSRPCLGAGVLWDCDDSDEFAREPQALIKLLRSLSATCASESTSSAGFFPIRSGRPKKGGLGWYSYMVGEKSTDKISHNTLTSCDHLLSMFYLLLTILVICGVFI